MSQSHNPLLFAKASHQSQLHPPPTSNTNTSTSSLMSPSFKPSMLTTLDWTIMCSTRHKVPPDILTWNQLHLHVPIWILVSPFPPQTQSSSTAASVATAGQPISVPRPPTSPAPPGQKTYGLIRSTNRATNRATSSSSINTSSNNSSSNKNNNNLKLRRPWINSRHCKLNLWAPSPIILHHPCLYTPIRISTHPSLYGMVTRKLSTSSLRGWASSSSTNIFSVSPIGPHRPLSLNPKARTSALN